MNPGRSDPLTGSMSDPDVALMIGFQGGDYDAFAELVERHTKALLNYFYFQGRDWGLAEDCCQEVWVRIFRARAEYSPRARFRTWLFRIARNLWIDVYRTQSRRAPELSLDGDSHGEDDHGSFGERVAARGPGPERDAGRGEVAAALASALARLPEEMREVYLLGEVEGLPYATISEVLDVPVGTVKSRMFNAVRRLRDILRGSELS